MATTPLFVANLATLQAKLRLTGLPSGQDGAALLNEAILAARVKFYRALGTARVAVLAALAFDEDPATEDEVLRALANTTEVLIVRAYLYDTMPVLFLDNSANDREVWNEESAFRPGRISQADRQRLNEMIEANLAILSGDVDLGDEQTGLKAAILEPDTAPDRPGASIFGVTGSTFLAGEV